MGCAENDLPSFQTLDRLRVLAILSDSYQIQPGDNLVLSAIISDQNQNDEVKITWTACPDPGIQFGAKPECKNDLEEIFTGIVSEITAERRTVQTSSQSFNIPTDWIQKSNAVLIEVELESQNKKAKAVRSLSFGETKQTDLEVEKLINSKNNEEIEEAPQKDISLEAESLSSVESYTWFTNFGSFESTRTATNKNKYIYKKPSSEKNPVWVLVVRDAKSQIAGKVFEF